MFSLKEGLYFVWNATCPFQSWKGIFAREIGARAIYWAMASLFFRPRLYAAARYDSSSHNPQKSQSVAM